jgi:hypothetical protein
MVHPVNLGGVKKTLHVFAQAEHSGTLLGGVTSDALKDTGAVMKHVRHYMHLRVVPLDEFAIMPNDVANTWCLYVFYFAIF